MKLKFLSLVALFAISACANMQIEQADPNPTPHDAAKGGGVFSEDGNLLKGFTGFSWNKESENKKTKIGVNKYLWQASLEAISFMPLIQADSSGGVILTDWLTQTNDVNKQIKVDIFINSKSLDPTALKVKVFNRFNVYGSWVNQTEDKSTATALEETILSKARALKIKEYQNN